MNYTVLNEEDRAQGWNAGVVFWRCDDNLTTGWYRFQGAAGDQMLDRCVPKWRCGTEYPGWLNGTHPTVAEDVVTREVCHTAQKNCCQWRTEIKVKNCNSYYVYELQKLHHCKGYCGNGGNGKLH